MTWGREHRDGLVPAGDGASREVPVAGGARVEQRRIVVGVDGSQWSKAALAWAVRQAELTGAVVEAVTAWELPATSGLDPQLYLDYPAAAAKMLTDAIAEVGSRATVHPRVKPGHPAEVLVGASDGAELLVVGSRGHGGFMGALLGSVSLHCIRHAHCPVVVIRGTRLDAREAPAPGPARSRVR